ncbi:hypothetical protein LOK49_LG14G00964, partial [Camellia lanceoleosa]
VCKTHLRVVPFFISKNISIFFRCRGGYSFLKLVNVTVGEGEERMMMTGLHAVADDFCIGCGSILGWKYETAHEKSQKYKKENLSLSALTSQLNSDERSPVQYPSSSSSSNGGQIGATTGGNHLSLSMSNNQQRPFINPPCCFAS